MEKWRGKTALVTGANSGIGAAVVRKLLELDMVVVGLDKQTSLLNEMKIEYKNGTLYVLDVDLTRDEEVIRAFQWIDDNVHGADVLINSAGLGGRSSLIEGSTVEWRNMLNVNVIALTLCTKEAIKSMNRRRVQDGHIILLSSNAAHIVPEYEPFHFYSATKFAVKALTEGFRQELVKMSSPVRVTSISPGIVKTPIVKTCLGDEIDKFIFENLPHLQTDDIASAVEYILSTPPHVQIHDLIIKPTGSSATN